MNLAAEQPGIVAVGLAYGVDPHLLLSIRQHEGDPPVTSDYGEFGMPRRRYADYYQRRRGSAATLRGLLMAYLGNPFEIIETEQHHRRLRYMEVVIHFIGKTYCPAGKGMPAKNQFWVPGVWQLYQQFTTRNKPLV